MKLSLTRRFRGNEEGSLSIETVFAIPMLVWVIAATFVFWDAFKTLSISQKATYTVADMLSRETNPIDADYMTSMREIFDFLAGDAGDNAIRVTVVTKTTNPTTEVEELQIVWSQGVDVDAYTDLDAIRDRLPTMALGEQLIVVESEQEFYEDYVQAPEAERRQDTAKRMRGTLRKRYGRLSDAQEKLVADWAQQRRDLAPLWHQRQQQWRAQWLLLLEERQSADFAERAEQLLFNSERDWPAELQQGAAENLRLWNQLLSDVHNISSDKQRQSLAQQLLDYAEDAEALSPT